jgi:hypothetical protein
MNKTAGVKVYRSDMVGCRRYFLTTRARKAVLFIGDHGRRPTQWLATGFSLSVGPRVSLTWMANR